MGPSWLRRRLKRRDDSILEAEGLPSASRMAGADRFGVEWIGSARQARIGMVWSGPERWGEDRHGLVWQARLGKAGNGTVGLG